jgi:DNA modification methylase
MEGTLQEKYQIVEVPVNELIPSEYNPRQANEKEIRDLTESIRRFGMVDPLIVNKNHGRKNRVIGGHFRLKIAKNLGYKKVPVVYVDIPDIEKEKELNLRLNKNLGEWDFDLLTNFDEELLKDVGFESEELDKIFQLDLKKDADEVPEVRQTDIKRGDLFRLGKHRLMCGDATKREDVEKLMDGKKADMVFTDPPYGINLDSSFKGMPSRWASHKYDNKYQKEIIGDSKSFDCSFLMDLAKEIFLFGADYYANTLPNSGIDGTWYVWDKREEENFDRMLGSPFELIWGKIKRGKKIIRMRWASFYTSDAVKGEKTKDRTHPTQKPIALCEWFVERFSKREQSIIDLFGGSGSTLIACERLNRRCFMMEIDPQYVQVIIDRWENYTGQKAEKIDD